MTRMNADKKKKANSLGQKDDGLVHAQREVIPFFCLSGRAELLRLAIDSRGLKPTLPRWLGQFKFRHYIAFFCAFSSPNAI
jgi:hypothetical protein